MSHVTFLMAYSISLHGCSAFSASRRERKMRRKGTIVSNWVIFGFHSLTLCWGLSVPAFLMRASVLLRNFEQILLISDGDFEDTAGSTLKDRKDMASQLILIHDVSSEPPVIRKTDVNYLFLSATIISVKNSTLVENLATPRFAHSSSSFIFLLCPSNNYTAKIEHTQLPFRFSLDSNTFWICEEGGMLKIWEIYSIKDEQVFQRIDVRENQDAVSWDLLRYKWKRRRNFRQVSVVATAADDMSYEDEVKFGVAQDGVKVLEGGMQVEIYRIFRDYLNFSESCIVGDYIVKGAGENGLVPMHVQLQNGTADVSITLSTVGEFKASACQMLHVVAASWLQAHFAADQKSSTRFFRGPFTNGSWLMVVLYFALMVILIKYVRWLTRGIALDNDIHADALWALSSLCVKGWPCWPEWTSLRIIFTICSAAGFLLYAAYSGALTSQLSVRIPTTVSLEGLLNRKYEFFLEYEVDFPVDLQNYPRWRNTRISILQQWQDFTPAIGKMSTYKSAVITYPEFFHFSMKKHNRTDAQVCEQYSSIRVSRTQSRCSMMVNKDSEFKEIFNIMTLFTMERSINQRLFKKYKRSTVPLCDANSHRHVHQTLTDISIAYLILLGGAITAVLSLTVELITANRRSHTRPHSDRMPSAYKIYVVEP